MPQVATYTVDDNASLQHLEPTVLSVATTHSIGTGTLFLCDTTTGFTISLPNASNNKNRVITLKKTSGDANTLTIDTVDSATIDGASSKSITTQYDSLTVQCDGANWYIIN